MNVRNRMPLGIVIGLYLVLGAEGMLAFVRTAASTGIMYFPVAIGLLVVGIGHCYREEAWRKAAVGYSVFMLLVLIASIFMGSMIGAFGVGVHSSSEGKSWVSWFVSILSWLVYGAPIVYALLVLTDDETKAQFQRQPDQTAQPGATDNPDDAQRLREDH